MRSVFLFLLLLVSISSYSEAAVRRICKVSYETSSGWSQQFKVEVTFMTGDELNSATRSYQFFSFDNYALIWFDKSQVAILKNTDLMFVSNQKFSADDFKDNFDLFSEKGATQVNSDTKRAWKIEAKDFYSWIDPRVD